MEFDAITPKLLRLRGEEIRCIDALPPGLLFDLAEMTTETDTMRTMAAIGKFLRAVIVPEDQDKYRQLVYDPVNVLAITELSEACGDLIREYAGRPTLRPSESADGSPPTGDISRVVSFSRGTVETVPASSPDGQLPAS
jgi:hypothetical protein